MSQESLHRAFTIAEIRVENYRTKTLVFEEPLAAQPGQYVMAWLPDVGEKPFSIAGNDPLALMVVAVGPFSEALHRLAGGDRVWVRGPLGRGFRIGGQRLLLVGGGYGVAPLLFLARAAIARGCAVAVCIGARAAADVLLVGSFTSAGAAVHISTEDGSWGDRGLVTTATDAVIRHKRPDGVYACGPVKMLEAVDQQCARYDLPRQLSWEAHMRCGMGLCGSCELDDAVRRAVHIPAGWLVCKDGPVSFSP
jgi:dihydroorotate dehydrogenase electron transfer subunit